MATKTKTTKRTSARKTAPKTKAARGRKTAKKSAVTAKTAGEIAQDLAPTAEFGEQFDGMGERVPNMRLPKGLWLSLTQFCDETGRDRQSINRKLRGTSVRSEKGRTGHPLYRVRDLIEVVYERDEKGRVDPELFDPYRRKAHYDAELNRMRMMTAMGQLVPVLEVEQNQARYAKIVAQFFDTLPDILERDCGVPPALLDKIEQRLDRVREDLYLAVVEAEEEHVKASAEQDEQVEEEETA